LGRGQSPCLAVSRLGEVDWTKIATDTATRLLLWELGSTMGSPHNALRSVQSLHASRHRATTTLEREAGDKNEVIGVNVDQVIKVEPGPMKRDCAD
jgi:hypothetical protein